MKISGEDIKKLIPQREPFIMVNEFEELNSTSAVTCLHVVETNYFILPDGTMAETGLIEHAAQSCAALIGYQSYQEKQADPPIGLIGEVKHFECMRRPKVGESVTTTIVFGLSFGQVTIATGECRVSDELIAKIQLKIFIQ